MVGRARLQLSGTGGARAYMAVSGGLDVPPYLGSRSTFPGGKLGGTQVARSPGHITPPSAHSSASCRSQYKSC